MQTIQSYRFLLIQWYGYMANGQKANSTGAQQITHLLQVSVLAPTSVAHMNEPKCHPAKLHIILPPLRSIAERYRNMSQQLQLKADRDRTFRMGVVTDGVRCETAWRNLTIPRRVDLEGEGSGSNVEASVNARAFCKLLRVETLAHRIILSKKNED